MLFVDSEEHSFANGSWPGVDEAGLRELEFHGRRMSDLTAAEARRLQMRRSTMSG